MARYSVIRSTLPRVQALGGTDATETMFHIIFATLDDKAVETLRNEGAKVETLKSTSTPMQVTTLPRPEINTDIMDPEQIGTPEPPVGGPGAVQFSPQDILGLTGLDAVRQIQSPPLYGKNLHVCLIDSGVRKTHQLITPGAIVHEMNLTNDVMGDGFNHGCTGPDSHVITNTFGQLRIEDLFNKVKGVYGSSPYNTEDEIVFIPEDSQLTTIGSDEHTSVKSTIKAVHRIRIKGEILRVHTVTGSVLLTPWHPCLTYWQSSNKYSYRRADQLRIDSHHSAGDMLARADHPTDIVNILGKIDVEYAIPPGYNITSKDTVTIDENVAYLIGLVLADGHLKITDKVGCIAAETEKEAVSISEIINTAFGYIPKYYFEASNNSWSVYIHAREWQLFVNVGVPIGKKSYTISIPAVIWNSPSRIQLAFIAGYIDGDGSFDTNKTLLRFISTSDTMMDDILYMLCSMGAKAYIDIYKDDRIREIKPGKLVECKDHPVVAVGGLSLVILLEKLKPYLRLRLPPSYVAKKTRNMYDRYVDAIDHETFDGYFYDLTTSTDNYLAGEKDLQFIHNTGTCSILLAVAPQASICNYKVLDSTGSGTEEEVVLAIQDILQRLAAGNIFSVPPVINMSLGAEDTNDPEQPIRVASRAAIAAGCIIIAACGNSGPNPISIVSPACEKYVGAIGSVSLTGPNSIAIDGFSSRGPTKAGLIKPDAVMFGDSIVMASASSDTATVVKSGTSFATPFASAIVLIAQEGIIRRVSYPGGVPVGIDPSIQHIFTAQQLLDQFAPAVGVKPTGSPAGKDNTFGYGLPLGALIVNVFKASNSGFDLNSIINLMMTMMIMKTMTTGSKSKKTSLKRLSASRN